MAQKDRNVQSNGWLQSKAESQVREAFEKHQLAVVYQPQYGLRTGRVVGMEALLRWISPTKAALLPSTFIPAAESSGMIRPIGEWVLHTACMRVREWNRSNGTTCKLSVNLSPKQFAGAEQMVSNVLHDTGFDPALLELEVTEQAVAHNLQAVEALLLRITKTGVHIGLDDFGTGYSSLQYLDCLPAHTLKIDRTFVSRVTVSPKTQAILRHCIGMAHELSMRVVGEGVETGQQRDWLKRHGCDIAQGFLYARPLAEPDARALLSRT